MFQSTRPVPGATVRCDYRQRATPVSIHAPRTGRDAIQTKAGRPQRVSIHAPRTGRDQRCPHKQSIQGAFQSTRPVRGATESFAMSVPGPGPFQSTRPVRGATPRYSAQLLTAVSFNPRAPYGARQRRTATKGPGSLCFNPRAPYGARPATGPQQQTYQTEFQSTRPVRGATFPCFQNIRQHQFQSTRPVRGATTMLQHLTY